MLPLRDHIGLPEEERARLLALFGRLRTLEEATRALMALGAPLVDLVTQDEYTHDVVFRLRPDRYLVFDAT